MNISLIGLTGKRESGKSHVANYLVEHYGFAKLHSFEPGKVMIVAYYKHLGVPESLANEMVYGAHKDTPFIQLHINRGGPKWYHSPVINPGDTSLSDFMPGPNSRDFMEKFGWWMGTKMGAKYTLLQEYRLQLDKHPLLVAESVVYEAVSIMENGGKIIKLVRPETDGKGTGQLTDAHVDQISPDGVINNTGTLAELETNVDSIMKSWGIARTK